MGDRLTVGQRPLKPLILVRLQVSQLQGRQQYNPLSLMVGDLLLSTVAVFKRC